MSFPITPVNPGSAIPAITPAGPSKGSGGFQSMLTDAIGRVEQFQNNSDTAINKLLNGEDVEIHKVALASQEASMAFDLFMQVRNKVVSAYQEVMRMQM